VEGESVLDGPEVPVPSELGTVPVPSELGTVPVPAEVVAGVATVPLLFEQEAIKPPAMTTVSASKIQGWAPRLERTTSFTSPVSRAAPAAGSSRLVWSIRDRIRLNSSSRRRSADMTQRGTMSPKASYIPRRYD
jgi:hypothetical protein